ncbi:peptidoglycan DD-metalloendopeptidase family protein [Photobacterium lucens]|uniref:peptidoglycan DD-metalloendopeptidase family protein n=1 Tax=Photobacterium lucens TaxID=2562949 RepID=UPI00136C178D|nr:peptidoglycan DD-metalloendopeptidase family protein [Photobacterium lucens]MBP2701453.1 peptidoglycan DD-metalloendopeptidase family protein [Vibrio parahaemolyticus]MZG58758.1 LysM peptidoglycan-binding domain-containing protein [Photobacterium lucens]MZG79423.1 LysM peptidoglycan-binding domain-containing protein [Photobacterium lucens]
MSTFNTTILSKLINSRYITLAGISLITVAAALSINTSTTTHKPTEVQLPISTTPEVVLKALSPKAMKKTVNLPPSYEYKIQKGDTLSEIFARLSIPYSDIQAIMEADLNTLQIDKLQPGNILRFWINESDHQLNKLELEFSLAQRIDYIRSKDGSFDVKEITLPGVWHESVATGSIHGSFSTSARKAGLSHSEVQEIMSLLKDKLNFNRDLKAGDFFEVVTNRKYIQNHATGDSELQAIRIYTGKNIISAYLHSDGNFYDQNGESLQRAFLRYPFPAADHFRISSPFNPNRVHPVTGRRQPHNGVDFASPSGTPVLATGDGVVTLVTNHPYAGRYVVIKHSANYSTRYLHNSRILVKQGQHVKRGQEIALSGSTGRVTGPHIHYEFLIRGKAVNPMTAKIPLAASVPNQEKKAFEIQVAKYNNLMKNAIEEDKNQIAIVKK